MRHLNAVGIFSGIEAGFHLHEHHVALPARRKRPELLSLEPAVFAGEAQCFPEIAIGEIWGDVTVSGDVEQIPWLLDSNNIYPNGTKRTIYHTFMGYDTIGARVLYINDNDDYLYSDAIVYNVKTGEVTVVPGSGVEEIGVDSHGDIVNVAYTSLGGVRIERPEMGIVLMTVTYSDGFVKTVKVARR